MNKSLLILLPVLFLCSDLIAQETVGFSDPNATYHLDDYRLPDWGFDLFSIDLNSNFSSSEIDNDAINDKETNFFGSISPSYQMYQESEQKIINLRAAVPIDLGRSKTTTATDYSDNETTHNIFYGSLQLDADIKYYLNDNLFLIGLTNSRLQLYSQDRDSDTYSDIAIRDKQANLSIGAGIGFGRVRNITPVIRSLRFNERLKALGHSSLSNNEIQQIAHVFAQRPGYSRLFDRPDRHFWDAISNAAPTNLENMSFYDSYYLSSALLETTGQRYQGWDVRTNFNIRHLRFDYERKENEVMQIEDDSHETLLMLGVAGRFFHNLNLKHMLSFGVEAEKSVTSFSEGDDNLDELGLHLSAGHLYNITDRLLLQSFISFDWLDRERGNYSDTFNTLHFESEFRYFVEDNLSLTANFSYSLMNEDNNLLFNSDESINNVMFRVGFQYDFIGRFR